MNVAKVEDRRSELGDRKQRRLPRNHYARKFSVSRDDVQTLMVHHIEEARRHIVSALSCKKRPDPSRAAIFLGWAKDEADEARRFAKQIGEHFGRESVAVRGERSAAQEAELKRLQAVLAASSISNLPSPISDGREAVAA